METVFYTYNFIIHYLEWKKKISLILSSLGSFCWAIWLSELKGIFICSLANDVFICSQFFLRYIIIIYLFHLFIVSLACLLLLSLHVTSFLYVSVTCVRARQRSFPPSCERCPCACSSGPFYTSFLVSDLTVCRSRVRESLSHHLSCAREESFQDVCRLSPRGAIQMERRPRQPHPLLSF